MIAATPVSISLTTKVCCSSPPFAEPSFSDRRPNRARSKAFRICAQPLDARIGIGIAGLEIGDFVLQSSGVGRSLGHGKYHGLQRL
ncbi:hypothetical protein ACVINW_003779 [Bradyrhizobium sp. USDA 4461]